MLLLSLFTLTYLPPISNLKPETGCYDLQVTLNADKCVIQWFPWVFPPRPGAKSDRLANQAALLSVPRLPSP